MKFKKKDLDAIYKTYLQQYEKSEKYMVKHGGVPALTKRTYDDFFENFNSAEFEYKERKGRIDSNKVARDIARNDVYYSTNKQAPGLVRVAKELGLNYSTMAFRLGKVSDKEMQNIKDFLSNQYNDLKSQGYSSNEIKEMFSSQYFYGSD